MRVEIIFFCVKSLSFTKNKRNKYTYDATFAWVWRFLFSAARQSFIFSHIFFRYQLQLLSISNIAIWIILRLIVLPVCCQHLKWSSCFRKWSVIKWTLPQQPLKNEMTSDKRLWQRFYSPVRQSDESLNTSCVCGETEDWSCSANVLFSLQAVELASLTNL